MEEYVAEWWAYRAQSREGKCSSYFVQNESKNRRGSLVLLGRRNIKNSPPVLKTWFELLKKETK